MKQDWREIYNDDGFDINFSISWCEEFYDSLKEIRVEKNKVDTQLQSFKGDWEIIETFKIRMQDYNTQKRIFEENETWEIEVREKHDELKKKRTDVFTVGLKQINDNLKSMFWEITCGGDALLEVKDNLDPFSEGVIFSVKPLNKSWKEIH